MPPSLSTTKRFRNKSKRRRSNIRKTYRYRNKIIRKNKMHNTFTLSRRMKGGHLNETLPHYHLMIRFPNGSISEMPESFQRSEHGPDGRETSGKVGDIMNFVQHNLAFKGIENRPFTLSWRHSKMTNPNVRIRDIRVRGDRIPLSQMFPADAIQVSFDDEIPPDVWTDADVAREAFDEDGNLRESF